MKTSSPSNSPLLPPLKPRTFVPPSNVSGLAVDPSEFIEEIQVRLRIPACQLDDFCRRCDATTDRLGPRTRGCGCAGDRAACHHAARNITSRVCGRRQAQPYDRAAPRPDDPSGSHPRRPADVRAPSWTHGQPAALDLASTSPQRQETSGQVCLRAGQAASQLEDRKRKHFGTEKPLAIAARPGGPARFSRGCRNA